MRHVYGAIVCGAFLLAAQVALTQGAPDSRQPAGRPAATGAGTAGEAGTGGAAGAGGGAGGDRAEARGVPEVRTTTAATPTARPQPARKVATEKKKKQPQTYVMRLRSLSERISTLKERVSQTKYRLSLLKEAVLHGTIAGCQLRVEQENRMGSSFRLISVRYALDGKGLYGKEDIGDTKLAKAKKVPIFAGPIPPGPHVLTVELKWRGHGYGVFSYLRGYRFRVLSSHSFRATEGTETYIRVKAYEKGNMTTPLKERPAIKFIRKSRTITPKKSTGKKKKKGGK
jgi:hypothetical protein